MIRLITARRLAALEDAARRLAALEDAARRLAALELDMVGTEEALRRCRVDVDRLQRLVADLSHTTAEETR